MDIDKQDPKKLKSLTEILETFSPNKTIMITNPLATHNQDYGKKIIFEAIFTHYIINMQHSKIPRYKNQTVENTPKIDPNNTLIMKITKDKKGEYKYTKDIATQDYSRIMVPVEEIEVGINKINKKITNLINNTDDTKLKSMYRNMMEEISNYVTLINNMFSEE